MDDDLVPPHLLRALRYLELVERGDGSVDSIRLDLYVSTDPPNAGWSYKSSLESLHSLLSAGLIGVSDYLRRVGWIEDDIVWCRLSDTGRAIVRASTARSESDEGHGITVLSPSDPLNLLALTRAIAGAKAGTLVDPYFKDEHLTWLIEATSISKLLLGRKSDSAAALGLAIDAARGRGRSLEIRYLPPRTLHDRYLIAEDTSVSTIGASINGLNRNFTVLTPVPDPGAPAIRRFVEEQWKAATQVEAWDGLEAPADVAPEAD